jgi:hypothetical protein
MPDKVIILTEGRADDVFIATLIGNRNIQNLEVIPPQHPEIHGYQNFELRLRNLRAGSRYDLTQYKAILIVADNDEHPQPRFNEITSQITAAGGYGVPTRPRELAESAGYPPIAVLMLPWDDTPGALETVLLEAGRSNLPHIAQCVDTFLACIDVNSWDMIKRLKLELRCLVSAACKNDPTLGVPHIWSSKNTSDGEKVPLGHSSFNQIAEYLRSL